MADLLTMHSFIEVHKRIPDNRPLQQNGSRERMRGHMLAANALNFLRESIKVNDFDRITFRRQRLNGSKASMYDIN